LAKTRELCTRYFVYDSKKSGSTTTSHLRFGPRPIHSIYLIDHASFVACHQWFFLEKFDVLQAANPGSTFLLNSIYGKDEVWNRLPRHIQKQLIDKKMKLFVIDAYEVAKNTGMAAVLIRLCKPASLQFPAFYRRMKQSKPLSIHSKNVRKKRRSSCSEKL